MASQDELDRVLMGSARLWSTLATCSRLSVGCVIADPRGRVVSSGFNGSPAGQAHCDHACDCGHDFEDPLGWDWHLSDCNSKQPCKVAVHSEANAIKYSVEPVSGYTMYCTHSPCSNCSTLIASVGIVRVVYGVPYRNVHPLEYLEYSGVTVEQHRGE